MKVLFLYSKSNELIRQHVAMLTEGLRQSVEVTTADSTAACRQVLLQEKPDIIHCHGCSNFSMARLAMSAINKGSRLVITPHGQLEPWATQQQTLEEKAGKIIQWQKEFIRRAYAVIMLGRLERTNFSKLGWNKRTEEIHNAVITNTISPQAMCSSTFNVYQKVMDSNTLDLMDEPTRAMLRALIKVGIMGDRRWISKTANDQLSIINSQLSITNWRHLLLYAEHEHIRNYVDYGINLLGLSVPSVDTSAIAAYFPPNYTLPAPIHEKVGEYEGNQTDYLLRIISQIRHQPLLLHLIEMTRELYRDTVNDTLLYEALEEKKLTAYAASLIQVLAEQTGLDEGFMPLKPVNNRQTRQIRKILTNHLKI